MIVTLTDHTKDPEQVIATCAAICYDGNTSTEANAKRLQKLMANGHFSTLRFAYATFHIQGISRVCSHQLVRTGHAGFLQRSQRYTNCKLESVHPKSFTPGEEYMPDAIWRHNHKAFQLYEELIASGVPREDARYILPQGVTTELYMTGNFQMWKHFLKLRTSKHAQTEIRDVAGLIHHRLFEIAPNIFPL